MLRQHLSRLRKIITSSYFKITFSLLLIAWLISKGSLDVRYIYLFKEDLLIAISAVLFWLLSPMILSSLRWKIILTVGGINISFWRSLQLQHLGVFFTTVLPGSLGGDIVKASIVVSNKERKYRSFIISSIILDRLLGMFGMFTIGTIGFIIYPYEIIGNKTLLVANFIMIGFILAFGTILILSVNFKVSSLLNRNKYTALLERSISVILDSFFNKKIYLITVILLSITAQALSFLLFLYITQAFEQNISKIAELASAFSSGMFLSTLPLSPGGFGVGHYAFDNLFNTIGLSNGANVYNLYFISQTVLNLTGVLTYILCKEKTSDQSIIEHTDKVKQKTEIGLSNETI